MFNAEWTVSRPGAGGRPQREKENGTTGLARVLPSHSIAVLPGHVWFERRQFGGLRNAGNVSRQRLADRKSVV